MYVGCEFETWPVKGVLELYVNKRTDNRLLRNFLQSPGGIKRAFYVLIPREHKW